MYYFIVNPNSRSSMGQKIWQQTEVVLKERNIEYQVFFTHYQHHATKIARELTQDLQEHTIVVLGGDGTVNEVVNGITDFSKVTLGYIPSGSGNDFARGMGLAKDPAIGLESILNPSQIRSMDVGILKYGPNSRKRCFAISAGLGFDAAICHQAMVSKVKIFLNKIKLGKLTYTLIALHRLILDQPVPMTITVDGSDTQHFDKVYFTAVMNNLYEGGGFKFCPAADSGDGILDAIVVEGLKKWQILLWLVLTFSGKHTRSRGVHIFRGKRIAIDSAKALPVHTDGEPVFLQRHMEASPSDRQLRVIVK